MDIYFCGSIRGGREDAALYHELIEKLKKYGRVLTEHVGDPKLTEFGGDGGSRFIWERDTAWLKACDIVIAECTATSMGVGYELGMASALGKPLYILYRGDERRLTAMVAGDPAAKVYLYGGINEADGIFREIFGA